MYIPEFWCGVVATILVELGIVIGLVILLGNNRKNSGGQK